jgi:hypothetical protein
MASTQRAQLVHIDQNDAKFSDARRFNIVALTDFARK